MGKLDVNILRYLSKEDFRVLAAVELSIKNHNALSSGALVAHGASLKAGGVHKLLKELCKNRLVQYERGKKFDGYRLTNKGFDYLALKALTMRGSIHGFGNQIGVGKESNIYIVTNEAGTQLCLKLHRLGRTCFRKVKLKRDYYAKNDHASWLWLSKASATREFAYMKALYDRGFPVPTPIDFNRHCVVMELVKGYPMTTVDVVENVEQLYDDLMNLIVRLGNAGVIHGDFNEFNIMITDDAKPILIDFPQMLSTSHPNAQMYFDRDVTGVIDMFKKKFGYESEDYPKFEDIERDDDLDIQVSCTGFTKKHGFTAQDEEDLLIEYHQPDQVEYVDNISDDCDEPDFNEKSMLDNLKKQVDEAVSIAEERVTNDDKNNKHNSVLKYVESMRLESDFEKFGNELGEPSTSNGARNASPKPKNYDNSVDLEISSDEERQQQIINIRQAHNFTDSSDEDDLSLNEHVRYGVEINVEEEKPADPDPKSRRDRYEMVKRLLSDAKTSRSYSTSASTIAPSVIKDRVKKGIAAQDKKECKKRCVPKGEASAVRRMRIENKDVVKDFAGWM